MDSIDVDIPQNRLLLLRNRVMVDDVPLIEGIRLPEGDVQRARHRALYILDASLERARQSGVLAESGSTNDAFVREFLGAARRLGAELCDMGLAQAAALRENGREVDAARVLLDVLEGELTATAAPYPDVDHPTLRQEPLGMSSERRYRVEYDLLAAARQLLRKARRDTALLDDVQQMSTVLPRAGLQLVDGSRVSQQLGALLGNR